MNQRAQPTVEWLAPYVAMDASAMDTPNISCPYSSALPFHPPTQPIPWKPRLPTTEQWQWQAGDREAATQCRGSDWPPLAWLGHVENLI